MRHYGNHWLSVLLINSRHTYSTSKAKVTEFDHTPFRDENVFWFDVSMQDLQEMREGRRVREGGVRKEGEEGGERREGRGGKKEGTKSMECGCNLNTKAWWLTMCKIAS